MDAETRKATVAELAESFGGAEDRSLGPDQPFLVLLTTLDVLKPWKPSPIKAVLRFTSAWPNGLPEFFVPLELIDADGSPPRNANGSTTEEQVLGVTMRRFSYSIPDVEKHYPLTPTRAVQLWLTRFSKPG